MINKVSKVFIVIFLLLQSCSGNRFKDAHDTKVFSFGLRGHDAFSFCKENDPEFMSAYPNGKYPGKVCTRYRTYTCHVNNYCNGDKQCERDAAQYWLKPWRDATTKELLEPIVATREICDKEQQRNSTQKK